MNPFARSTSNKSNTTAQTNDDDHDEEPGFLNPNSTLPSNHTLQTSDYTRERSVQQLELSDVYDPDLGPPGMCGTILGFLILKLLHPLNFTIGKCSIIYGSLLVLQFTKPAMAAAIFCLTLGVIHVGSSLVGMISYWVWSGWRRIGLKISAVVGPYWVFVYLIMLIGVGSDLDGFLMYLDDNKEVLYMGPNVVENCRELMPLIYTLLAVLGLLEAVRYPTLTLVRLRLLHKDEADALIPKPSYYEKTGKKHNTTANAGLTEALLEGGGVGGDDGDSVSVRSGAVSRETTGTPDWWNGQE
mmetsp:Transcript_8919/g.19297  ORF Transcript_8919/g.19297 Transcript_8919/m.19297 type:complete len:299 (+) Transcript_8919:139-1035(+)